jgi:hypothetical protein
MLAVMARPLSPALCAFVVALVVEGCGSSPGGHPPPASGGAAGLGGGSGPNAGASGSDAAGIAGTAGTAGAGTAGAAGGLRDGGAADAAPGTVPFKGVSFTGTTCADLDKLGAAWFYDWGTSSSCKTNAQFVPMVWGGWTATANPNPPAKLASAGQKIVLGFNEPDHADQAHLTVAAALALWPAMDQPGFERVGSPATASDGQAWFEQFMMGVEQQGLRVDFIALHWYGWDAGSCASVAGLEAYVKWAEQWHKPLWLTEWSCRMQSAEVTRKFYDDAIAMFAKHPLLERYAWFLTRTATDADFSMATLLDASGNPTALGTDYTNAPVFR